ncbi:MAG: hypothetical protein ACR2IY_00090, partial [Rubrivivax sp.]
MPSFPTPQALIDPRAQSLPRRQFIRLAGGGAILAATGGLAACSSEMPEAAVQAWRDPGAAQTDVRRFMLA